MTMQDGGPAFSRPALLDPAGTVADQGWLGMSLRDWFAGQALTGLIAAYGLASSRPVPEGFAERSYAVADAMLGVRQARIVEDLVAEVESTQPK